MIHPNEVRVVIVGQTTGLPIATAAYIALTTNPLTTEQREALTFQVNRQVKALREVADA